MTEQRFALVTGANKGIGFATVRELASRGITVYMGSRDKSRGEAAAQTLASEKLDVRFVQLDVTSPESIEAARAHVEREAGSLHILINNAGISVEQAAQATLEGMRRVYETNVFGLLAVTRAFAPLLEKGRPSRIVNVSSTLGSLAFTSKPLTDGQGARLAFLAYGSSKTAVNALTVHLAGELKDHGITVVAAAPGYCATDLNHGRGVHPPEHGARIIAKCVLELDEAQTGGFFDENGRAPW